MPNYHVLASDKKKRTARTVYHLPVPNTNNDANKNYRTMLAKFIGDFISTVPDLSTDHSVENTALINGELYEYANIEQFPNIDQTPVQKRTYLDSKFTEYTTSIIDKLLNVLNYYGAERDVP